MRKLMTSVTRQGVGCWAEEDWQRVVFVCVKDQEDAAVSFLFTSWCEVEAFFLYLLDVLLLVSRVW